MDCRIGITCGWLEEKNWHKIHDEYIAAVTKAGGIPFLLPSLDSPELADVYYNQLDGFIFSGGGDVASQYYGEEPLNGSGKIAPIRDAFEMSLAKLALEGSKPVLGICRGIQLLNIAAGGDIYQDLKGVTDQLHNQEAPRWYPTHTVEVEPGSGLFGLTQRESFPVNSFHHQGIRRLGKDFKVAARSKDGLIEAVESSAENKTIIAVQWHPECNWDRDSISFSIFKNLINEAAKKGGTMKGNNRTI